LLRPGGRALITVWAKDQTKSNYLCKNKTQSLTEEHHVTANGVNLPVHENRTQFQHSDVLVPWKLRNVKENKTLTDKPEDTLLRYYHVFEEGELDDLCRQLPLEVEQSFYEEGNWCVVCKKINDT
jgi:alkylated DNA repair protein alkB homolog 8